MSTWVLSQCNMTSTSDVAFYIDSSPVTVGNMSTWSVWGGRFSASLGPGYGVITFDSSNLTVGEYSWVSWVLLNLIATAAGASCIASRSSLSTTIPAKCVPSQTCPSHMLFFKSSLSVRMYWNFEFCSLPMPPKSANQPVCRCSLDVSTTRCLRRCSCCFCYQA